MTKALKLLLILFLFLAAGCRNPPKPVDHLVKIKTSYGDMIIKLYNDTPNHRDNFLKLIHKGFYNGLLFHRVIPHFMIQGGDPGSRNAKADELLGNNDVGYTIPAEFNPAHFHKKGALAAARNGDRVNPEKRSSGSQFYIVEGKVFTEAGLDSVENQINESRKENFISADIRAHQKMLEQLQNAGKQDEFAIQLADLRNEAAEKAAALPPFHFSEKARKSYTSTGGYPSLDQNYTVFGEVIKGLDVIDKIAAVKTDSHDRPMENIKMTITVSD